MTTPVPIPRTVAEVFDRVLDTDPDRELLVTRSGRFSYADIDRLANRAAHALASLGVGPGDRVAGSLPNEVDVVVAFHGAMRLGAVWVGLNRALAPPEKEYLLADSGTSLLLCDAPTAEQVAAVSGLHDLQVVVVDPAVQGGVWQDEMTAASDAPVGVDVDPHAPAGIAYTSGTTGHPKGAVHSQYNLLMPGAVLVASRGYGPNFRRGDSLPLTILNMQVLTTLMTAQAGGCSVIMDRIDAAGVAEWIREERVTAWNGPPAVIHSMAHMDEIVPSDLATLTEVWVGGADCPESIRQRVPAEVRDAVAHHVRVERGADRRHHRRSRRWPRRRRERQSAPAPRRADRRRRGVHRADDDGAMGGAYRLMLGYWERPEATAETLAGGLLHTGDLGFLDDDGYLHIRDRKSLVIIRGGANVYPAEVERVVHEIDGVAACAVLGLPDERLGERVVAAVELVPGAEVTEDRSHRVLPREPRQVQSAGTLGVRRRVPAQLDEQDPAPGARRPVRVIHWAVSSAQRKNSHSESRTVATRRVGRAPGRAGRTARPRGSRSRRGAHRGGRRCARARRVASAKPMSR